MAEAKGLKKVFVDLADTMYNDVFTDMMDQCVYVDQAASFDGSYDVETGTRVKTRTGYLVKKARFSKYSEQEVANNQNILQTDIRCKFPVKTLTEKSVNISIEGLIVDSRLAEYSIENLGGNDIVCILRIRKRSQDGTATDMASLFS